MTTASQARGIAPLAVFFDAVDTVDPAWTSGVPQPADGDYARWDYRWDFGDAASGVWATSGRSRNAAAGCMAAHVYELPGTYTVTLKIDNTTSRFIYAQTITVTAFECTTYYVSSSQGNDENPGTAEDRPFRTFEKAIRQLGSGIRILFRAGDSWTTDTHTTIDSPGPGILGSYGEGPPPAITYTGSEEAFFKVNGEDWRFVNLSLAGMKATPAIGVWQNPGARRLLLLNLKFRDFTCGVFNRSADGWPHEQLYLVGVDIGSIGASEDPDAPTSNGLFLGARRSAVLGTSIHDFLNLNGRTEHGLRVWYANKFVISHNSIYDPPIHGLKLHAYGRSLQGPAADSRHVVISDNTFRGGRECVKLAPQDSESDEYVRDVVFERNTVLSNRDMVTCVFLQAQRVTLRNNLLVGTGGGGSTNGFHLERLNPDLPVPSDIRILHNTLWRNDMGDYMELVGLDPVEPDSVVVVRNNVASLADARRNRVVVTETWPNLAEDHNLLHHATSDPPIFRDPLHGDFRLLYDSRTVDRGTAVPGVFTDFNDLPRPQRGGVDLGAFELGWTLSGTVTLQGFPADVAGLPLTIEFRGARGDNTTRTTTLLDARGGYSLEDVAADTYDLVFSVPGWQMVVMPKVVFDGQNDVTGANLLLANNNSSDNSSPEDGPIPFVTPVTPVEDLTVPENIRGPVTACFFCPAGLVVVVWAMRRSVLSLLPRSGR